MARRKKARKMKVGQVKRTIRKVGGKRRAVLVKKVGKGRYKVRVAKKR